MITIFVKIGLRLNRIAKNNNKKNIPHFFTVTVHVLKYTFLKYFLK